MLACGSSWLLPLPHPSSPYCFLHTVPALHRLLFQFLLSSIFVVYVSVYPPCAALPSRPHTFVHTVSDLLTFLRLPWPPCPSRRAELAVVSVITNWKAAVSPSSGLGSLMQVVLGVVSAGHSPRASPGTRCCPVRRGARRDSETQTLTESEGGAGRSVIGQAGKPKKENERAAHCTFYKPIIIKIVFLNLCFIFRADAPSGAPGYLFCFMNIVLSCSSCSSCCSFYLSPIILCTYRRPGPWPCRAWLLE